MVRSRRTRRRGNRTFELPASKPVSSYQVTGSLTLTSGNNYVTWAALGIIAGSTCRISSVWFDCAATSAMSFQVLILDGSGIAQVVSRQYAVAGSNAVATLRNSKRSPLTLVATTSTNMVNFIVSGAGVVAYVIRGTSWQ